MIHRAGDGLPSRVVRVNGKVIERVFYANTARGIARAYRYPYKLDKYRKRALERTYRGRVEVSFLED